MTRCAIYVRVSTEAQVAGTSLETQEAACRTFAGELGLDIVDVLKETYTGVEYFDRPAMTTLRRMMRERSIDAVMFYVVDRVSRGGIYAALLHEEARDAGIRLYAAEARWTVPMTDAGELLMYIGGWQGKGEWRQLRERIVRGKRGRLEQGLIHRSGADLYGYRRDRDAGVRVIYEPEAAIVRDIFTWYAIDGLGLRAVANRLNDLGIPSPATGKITMSDGRTPHWGKTQVGRLIANASYVGETILWRWQSNGPHVAPSIRPESEWIKLPDHVTPPIVERDVWDAAQSRLTSNRGEQTRNLKRPALLRGLVLCAVCGRRMSPDTEHGKQRIYRCNSRTAYSGACGASRVPAAGLDAWVMAEVRDYIAARARGEAARLNAANDDGTLALELAAARSRLARIVAGQERIITQAAQSDAVPWDLVEREVGRGEREKAPIIDLIARLEQQAEERQASARRTRTVDEWCLAVVDDMDGWTFVEWRFAVEWLGLRVVANGVDWRLTTAD